MRKAFRFLNRIISLIKLFKKMPDELQRSQVLLGSVLSFQFKEGDFFTDPRKSEFKVFSQFGEDGIIQYLLKNLRLKDKNKFFVEFGVETFTEANCRFLMIKDNWRGLVIDGSSKNISIIKRDPIYWRHDLTAVASFVDKDNINAIISKFCTEREIGILSVDIDGNDYWVLDAINVVDPIVIIAEYNSVFGPKRAVTVPYDPKFQRGRAHYSNLYWGASIAALTRLANSKGYELVAGNSAGNNIFFVRRDMLNGLRVLTIDEAYSVSRFRESRNKDGSLSFLSGDDRLNLIADMPVYDLDAGAVVRLGDG